MLMGQPWAHLFLQFLLLEQRYELNFRQQELELLEYQQLMKVELLLGEELYPLVPPYFSSLEL
jgi:hypothetical protein